MTPGPSSGAAKSDSDRRRILSLDGGGIRGIVSVEVLARLERMLRERTGDPHLLLRDWFDMIAGTSTGAITAALLATGHSAARIRAFYREEGADLFERAPLHRRLRHRYDATRLSRRLRERLGADVTLGSDRVHPLLMLVLRNATTDSPWVLTNHPAAPFNDPALADCNLDLPLWRLVRASAAAPTFFEPEEIRLGEKTFVFADGAITGLANPAFRAFLVATLPSYRIGWPTGADRLLLVSVGTGRPNLADPDLTRSGMHLLYHARTVPLALTYAMRDEQDLLCRAFGECRAGEPLDLEVGDMIGTPAPGRQDLYSYVRYDVSLTPAGLEDIGCGDLDPADVARIDAVDGLEQLQRLGRRLGESRVRPEHFAPFLDNSHRDPNPHASSTTEQTARAPGRPGAASRRETNG